MDFIAQAMARDPDLHIYHFNHYEPTALKKLMGRYATRERQLDELLRGGKFVDLYTVVRQAVRAGVESYSIKQLEQFYDFTREVGLRDASAHLQEVELALESNDPARVTKELRDVVAGYNRDDCRSTLALRDWLETLRASAERDRGFIPRPEPKPAEPSDATNDLDRDTDALRAQLLSTLDAAQAMKPEHPDHPRWLLAYLIDWHRREEKSDWWEYYRLRDLPEQDLLDEPDAITGLEFVERTGFKIGKNGKPTKSVIDRYRYPIQEMEIGRKTKLKLHDNSGFGTVVARDPLARTIDIEKGPSKADVHPRTVYASDVVGTKTLQRSVMRVAESRTEPSCGMDLLYRRTPRLTSGEFRRADDESAEDFARRIVTSLDRTTLAIQGPPGAGKTFTGAQMIRACVAAGLRVGVTANSHKVILNLLEEVSGQAARAAERVRLAHKVNEAGDEEGSIRQIEGNDAPLEAMRAGEVDVLGGTAWLWAREEYAGLVDVLFVDEAGQMSLANALAVSPAAKSLVLLGDPQQLDQPQKASHPDGVSVSALQHVIGEAKTMPPDRGIFIDQTWRLAPSICAFTSEMFYSRGLRSKPGLERQVLAGTQGLDGAGLWMVTVDHDGGRSWSQEEIDTVASLVDRLLAPGSTWIDETGAPRRLTPQDLRIVAPFNAHVNRLQERLSALDVPVGTVDKFQGQTAAVVIYSMATSRPEDAPRGMEFLYSLNRLNVATSRARCAAIVVCSPKLLEPQCRTPRQMKLANALARFRELAPEDKLS